MKERSKKLLALFLTAAMTCSLAACGGDDAGSSDVGETSSVPESKAEADGSDASAESESESGDGEMDGAGSTTQRIVDDELTLYITGGLGAATENWQDLAVIDEFANRLGIRLDCNLFQTDWNTQLTLMISSDEIPDMIVNAGMTIGDLNKWGAEGYFLNLKDYLDVMPNLQAYFEEYPELEAFCTSSDGSIYGLSRIRVDLTDRMTRSYINQGWLDNLNLSVPTSIDELYDVLVAFKEQDANGDGNPDNEVPVLYTSGSALERTLMDAFGIHTSDVTYILQADNAGKVVLANTTDAWKEYMQFMQKLYAEGLMEQEAYTITGEETTDKMQNDLYGLLGTGSAPFVLARQDISYDANWSGIAGLTSDIQSERTSGVASPVSNSIMIAVGANTEHPEEIARFLDYFYTDEGKLAATRGYDGVTFDYVRDELLDYDDQVMRQPEGFESGEEYRYKGAVLNEVFNLVEENGIRARLFEVDPEVLLQEDVLNTYGWAAQMAYANRQDGIVWKDTYPVVAYTTEEVIERSTLYTDVRTYLDQAKAEFITGNWNFDSDWDDFISTLNQMGLERLMEIEQAAYDRYKAVVE